MRIGFVLECQTGGSDATVYKYVAERLCPTLSIEKPKTLVNKIGVFNEGPAVTQTLLETGCDFVFVIWDRKPRFGVLGNCETDIATFNLSLVQLNIDLQRVFVCCIDEMLESWLIIDGRGFDRWLQLKTNHPLADFGDHTSRAEQSDPKNRIRAFLRINYGAWKYNESEDNFEIVKHLPDFDRAARWNESFRFFKESVEAICP